MRLEGKIMKLRNVLMASAMAASAVGFAAAAHAADSTGGFFAYLGWSTVILLPLFLLTGWLFF